jgi:hypothetical protein
MKPRGELTKRWEKHRALSRELVRRRAHGKCESCYRYTALDWSHVAGRGNVIAEPLASSPELTQGLCRPCHRAFDGHTMEPKKRRGLEQAALMRLAARFHKPLLVDALAHPFDAIRRMVEEIEKEGASIE